MLRATTSTVRRINLQARPFPSASPETREAWLFVDSVFPIQIARWDLRHYVGILREEALLTALRSRLETVKAHGFDIISLEPHQKDGGVFVQFKYSASDSENALTSIESRLREEAKKYGGLPSWLGFGGGNVWLVRGTPWREDMSRFASPILKIAFEGPDMQEQTLYQLFRPYGQIHDLTQPSPVPVGTPRFSTITYKGLRSATIARNVIHGLDFPSPASGTPGTLTRLRAAYQQPIQAHAVRAWLSSHPKIVLPMVVFLLGTLTYTIFDPIRALMVQGKMLDWFDYREFKIYKWLRVNTLDRLSISFNTKPKEVSPTEEVWKERKEAEAAMKAYVADMPTTITFVHGPQGSGKSRMLEAVLRESGRKALIVDCGELLKATSDSQLVGSLAGQTGYWPVFTFLNSVNNLIDLASVGLIGQKAGLSSSLPDQLHEILKVVGTGLKAVSATHRSTIQRQFKQNAREEVQRQEEERKRDAIRRGTWHDGRLDCVAGNGVMSELGIGDEMMVTEKDGMEMTEKNVGIGMQARKEDGEERARKQKSKEEVEAVGALPVVVIQNFAARGGTHREELLEVLAQWAATLVESQVSHVIVISDNRENSKRLAKALSSKPLNSIALTDADAFSALSFVKQKLRDADISLDITPQQTAYIERLGGRATDLESLIHKVRSGQRVEEAVEDIINRAVGELRKNAFGDDADDAKNLPWQREQAWAVMRLLSDQAEASYYGVLLEFPFKGDEAALRSMEHAELITVGTRDGRPSTIRPGRPVFRWVFERLANDPIFRATQDIALNEKAISSAEKTVRTCEEELVTLKGILGLESKIWWGAGGRSASSLRAKFLLEKMLSAEAKIEKLDKKNLELKEVLARGE